MINEDFVSYEIAQALKKAGFDWDTDSYYGVMLSEQGEMLSAQLAFEHNDEYEFCDYHERFSAPTLAQAQKWVREIHNIHVLPHLENVNRPQYVCHITQLRKSSERLTDDARYFDTYESALSAGIESALKLIEEEQR